MTFIKCQKCGVFFEYESKSWTLKGAKPICYKCLDAKIDQENTETNKEEGEKNEKNS